MIVILKILAMIRGVALLIFTLPAAKFAWRIFPYKISRRERYGTSDYDYFIKRLTYALSAAFLTLGCGIFLIAWAFGLVEL